MTDRILPLLALGVMVSSVIFPPVATAEIIGQETAAEQETHETAPSAPLGNPLILPDGTMLHPLCLRSEGVDERHVFPASGCVDETIILTDEIDRANHYVSVPYQRSFAFNGDAPDYVERGYVGYHYAGPYQGQLLIGTVESTGGTGFLSALGLYTVQESRGRYALERTRVLAGGDRCNGGIAAFGLNEQNLITHATHVTALALMTLGGSDTGSTPDAYDTPFDRHIVDCAACCYGIASFENGLFQEVSLSPTLYQDIQEREQHGTPQDCMDGMILDLFEQGRTKLDRDALAQFTEKVEQRCLSANPQQE